MTNRIAEITARCEEGRPIRRIDVKYLLEQLAEREKELERLRGQADNECDSCACEIAVKPTAEPEEVEHE